MPVPRPQARSRRRRWRAAAALLALALVGPWARAQAQGTATLRFAVSQGLSAPFVLWREGTPVEGLDLDLARLIAEQLHQGLELVVLPRARIERALENAEADLACNLSPGARSERPDSVLRWTPPLFELPQLLVGHVSAAPVDQARQIEPGSPVGTLAGQSYPQLDPLFGDGRLRRDDALSEERLLRKLTLNRHPYGLLSRQALSWYAEHEGLLGVDHWRVPVGSLAYRCAVSARGRTEARRVLDAIEQLQQKGRVEQLLASQMRPALAVVVATTSPLRSINRQQLGELYTGRRERMSDGAPSMPVMSSGLERQLFLQTVLQISPSQYRSAWAALQFGGRRSPPLELRDSEAIKSHLARNSNAIGYLPLSQVDASLRVIYLP